MNKKNQLIEACREHVNKRITSYKDEIETIKDAIENNDKSSDEADDPGNGKLLNDLEKNSLYLNDAYKMMDTLKLINPKVSHDYVALGSLVTTNTSNFFMAISLGKVDIDGASYFVISKNSPIGEQLMHKSTGDTISFNQTSYKITDIK